MPPNLSTDTFVLQGCMENIPTLAGSDTHLLMAGSLCCDHASLVGPLILRQTRHKTQSSSSLLFYFLSFKAESLSLKWGLWRRLQIDLLNACAPPLGQQEKAPPPFYRNKTCLIRSAKQREMCRILSATFVPAVCVHFPCRHRIDHVVQQIGDQAGLQQGCLDSGKQTVIDLGE